MTLVVPEPSDSFSTEGKKPSSAEVFSASLARNASVAACAGGSTHVGWKVMGFFLSRRILIGKARIPTLRIRIVCLPSDVKGRGIQRL